MKPKKLNRHNDILFILVSSFVVVVLWIGFNLYHVWVTSTISETVQLQLRPIVGHFDTETIQKLKTREKINPVFERSASSDNITPSPTPTVIISLSPTPSIEILSVTPISIPGQ